VVEAAPPAVGPEPASREASSFVTFSISAVHCPASADATGKATRIQVPSINAIVLTATSPGCDYEKAAPFRRLRRYDINRGSGSKFRASGEAALTPIGSRLKTLHCGEAEPLMLI
jgi:hypothetical protein